MSLFPGPDKSVFWFDFEELTNDNKWRDKGPHSLHASPQAGFAAPNYGLSRNEHGKGYANFTGAANVYATLTDRFYNYAPSKKMTFVFAAKYTTPVVSGRIFNCRAAVSDGFLLAHLSTNAERINFYAYNGASPVYIVDTDSIPYTGRTYVSVFAIDVTDANNRAILHDGQPRTATASATVSSITYDTSITPTIGYGAGLYFYGQMYFMALFPFVLTEQESKSITRWMRDKI